VDIQTAKEIVRQKSNVYFFAAEDKRERLDDLSFDLHLEEAFEGYWRDGGCERFIKEERRRFGEII